MIEAIKIQPRMLMGPGPSDVNPRVLAALAQPTVGHLDGQFLVILNQVREMLQGSSLHDSIELISYLAHSESVEALLRSDALLLIVDEAGAGSDEIVPGKVFEYIGAQRPIIALAPEGAIAELMRETHSGFVAPNQDIRAIQAAFIECYENFLYHKKSFEQDREAVKPYDRREITRQLAALLDALSPRH